jgi:AcrR family transcriptional regulator
MPRTPSSHAHDAALQAALKLIARGGIEGTSVDAIADTSGISKATIYKHWKDKEALCLEAIGRLKAEVPLFDTGNPRADLIALLRNLAHSQKPEALLRIWPRVMSYAAGHPEFARAFCDRVSGGKRAQISGLLRRAAAAGELCAGYDVDLAMDLLIGPIMHHHFMHASVPPDLPPLVVEAYWRAHAPKIRKRESLRRGQHRNGKA